MATFELRSPSPAQQDRSLGLTQSARSVPQQVEGHDDGVHNVGVPRGQPELHSLHAILSQQPLGLRYQRSQPSRAFRIEPSDHHGLRLPKVPQYPTSAYSQTCMGQDPAKDVLPLEATPISIRAGPDPADAGAMLLASLRWLFPLASCGRRGAGCRRCGGHVGGLNFRT